MNQGIIYVVTGQKKKYWAELDISIKSVKKTNPDILISVATDNEEEAIARDLDIMKLENPSSSFYDKLNGILASPYEQTIYLDTDTYVCSEIGELFHLLNQFDLAVAHDQSPYKWYHSRGYELKYNISKAFPEMNTGVMAYVNNDNFRNFMQLWKRYYQDNNTSLDQPTFRAALYHSNLRIATLTPEYNMRISGPVHFQMEPKIIHARRTEKHLAKISKQMKKHVGIRRVYIPKLGILMNLRNMLKSFFGLSLDSRQNSK